MIINIFNNYDGNITFDYEKIIHDLETYFTNELKISEEVSLILVDLEEIQKINHDYRHLDYPTDVISFEDRSDDYLGDIFICIDKVFEQAKTYEHSVEREFAFLACHGLLHLLGYDHLNPTDEATMFTKQEEILEKTNYRRIING
jgi:probable rRNA maturation factor